MNPDEAIENIKWFIKQIRKESLDKNSIADELESNLKILETAIVELKDKAEYWDRLKIRKDIRQDKWTGNVKLEQLLNGESDLAGLAEWLHNG